MPLEIERKFLLSTTPVIPPGAEIWRIEQGYLGDSPVAPSIADAASGGASGGGMIRVGGGRLRRVIMPDGSVVCTHTIKSGSGLVRSELERAISNQQFEDRWPATSGRRLRKLRHRVREHDRIWEIDVFDQMDLVLAEVELSSPDEVVQIPRWLKAHIVREVTDDPGYTNASIAARAI